MNDSVSQGFRIERPSAKELKEVLDAAFDYRGDVTLTVAGGDDVVGYIFNRVDELDEPYVEVFPKDSTNRQKILYRDILGLFFSGKDTASGKSWETWVKKYEAEKAARERGEDVGPIQIEPEALD